MAVLRALPYFAALCATFAYFAVKDKPMLIETFHSIATALRKLLKNWQSMVLLAIVYAALLAAVYFFMAIREASIAQVVLTFGLAIAAFVLFFLLHAIVVGGIAGISAGDPVADTEPGVGRLLKRSVANFWKLVVISLPLIALAVLIAYLLGKAQNYFWVEPSAANDMLGPMAGPRSRSAARPPINWRMSIFSSLRYLSFGLLLPLATIHLWLATVRDGLWPAIRRIGTHLSRAFAPQSVLIYILGFLVFGLLPYFLLFKTIPTSKAWLEISLLVVRLAVVFALTLFGWVITVWALSLSSTPPTHPSPSAEAAAVEAREAA
jgi:hypothetical protein